MAATIRDVAKRAGVGIATVSRVLNESPSVSDATRERVLEAIAALNYTPNPIARRLSTGRTLTIGVIVPFFTLPDFVKRLQGVQSALAESEYDLVLFNVENVAQREKYFGEMPRHTRVDGLLVIAMSPSSEQLEQLHKAGVPVVLVDAVHAKASRVIVDHVAGARMAVEHLTELGHRRIGFVSDLLDAPFNFAANQQRYEGYLRGLAAAGIEFRAEYHQQGTGGREAARQMGRALLTLPEPPTAIFAASDTQAIGVMEAARALGLRVPEHLSVVGYSDLRDAEYLNLTTVHQPLFDSGIAAVELLLEAIDSASLEPQEVVLPLELVVRGSTAAPHAAE
ncbi:MAG: LacI family DNA-binding transcriptional regulator [Anaerolineales bacterium]